MLDIKFVRENPDAVKENIKKKFQDAKLPLVDEVIMTLSTCLPCARFRSVTKIRYEYRSPITHTYSRTNPNI